MTAVVYIYSTNYSLKRYNETHFSVGDSIGVTVLLPLQIICPTLPIEIKSDSIY